MKVIAFLLFLGSFCFASTHLSRFSFNDHFENLKNIIESGEGDISPVLDSFNKDTRLLFRNVPLKEEVKEYISIKEEIICLLMKNPKTDFGLIEFERFNICLLKEIARYKEYFKSENFHFVLLFALRTSIKNISRDSARAACVKYLHELSCEQLELFMSSDLFRDDESEPVSEIDQRISLLPSSSDPEQVYSIFSEILNGNLKVSSKSQERLADRLKLFYNAPLQPERLILIFDTIKYFYISGTKSNTFTTSVIDFFFSANVMNVTKDMKNNVSFCLMFYFISSELQILQSKVASMPEELKPILNTFSSILRKVSTLIKLLNMVKDLNDDSNEIAFKLAIKAVERLLELKDDEFIREILILETESVNQSLLNYTSIYGIEYHPLNCLAWKLAGMLGYLYYDLYKSDKQLIISCSTNIITGFGHVLLEEDLDSLVNSKISIDHLRSIMDRVIKITLVHIKKLKTPFQYRYLQAIIKFIELHPSVEKRNAYIDQFCLQYISDVSTQFNHYSTIENIQVTDRNGVYVTGFLTFLESYNRNSSTSKLTYLRDFYAFLKDSRLLSKTEFSIIENHFKGFKKTGRKMK